MWVYLGCALFCSCWASTRCVHAVDEKMLAEWRDEHAAWRASRSAAREDCALNHRTYLVTPACAWAQG